MKLKDTIRLMRSKDYKERFIAEYWQLKIRYEKLSRMCELWDKGELAFTPTCPRSTYTYQLCAMENYMSILEDRAVLECINLKIEIEIDYVDVVEEVLNLYKDKNLNWWSWDDFKSYLKIKIEKKYGRTIDFRTQEGKDILNYARNKWEMIE